MVVKAGVALGHRFQAVVEVEHHFGQGQVIDHHCPRAGVRQIKLDAATVLAQLQDVTKVIIRHHDGRLDPRLFDVVDIGQVGHVGGVVQVLHGAVLHVQLEDHRRRGGDQVDIIFAFQAVADDFKVQQTKEAAAEAETKRGRGFHLGRE